MGPLASQEQADLVCDLLTSELKVSAAAAACLVGWSAPAAFRIAMQRCCLSAPRR